MHKFKRNAEGLAVFLDASSLSEGLFSSTDLTTPVLISNSVRHQVLCAMSQILNYVPDLKQKQRHNPLSSPLELSSVFCLPPKPKSLQLGLGIFL